MSSMISRFNTSLGEANAKLRYQLWRRTLGERLRRADAWEEVATGPLEKSVAVIWRDTCWGSVKVREWTACPRGDRALGTGAQSTDQSRPDVDRIDIGHMQRDLAHLFGGSDLAVAATHLPFAVARLAVALAVGTITALGAVIGGVRGVARAPYVLMRAAPNPTGSRQNSA